MRPKEISHGLFDAVSGGSCADLAVRIGDDEPPSAVAEGGITSISRYKKRTSIHKK